jgi:RNA-binding protein
LTAPSLTNAQIRFLRGQAHGLKAMLQVGGKGVTDALIAEIDLALEHHELIKVKVAAEDREARDAMIGAIAERVGAALVQRIGHTAVLYRPSRDKRQIVLPRA